MRVPEGHGGSAAYQSTRLGVRTVIVIILAFAMTIATIVVPARAGETAGGDLEGVRATVLETYNGKINSLSERKASTDNSAKIEVYSGGINQLTNLRDQRVISETNIEELWALKSTAHGIYESTVAAAANAGMTDAEILAKAKNKALSTIDYKIGLLRDWIAGCEDPNARAIVDAGIAKINALRGELDGVTNPDVAWAIKERAVDIYHATKSAAEAAKGDDVEKKDKEPTEAEKAAEALAKTRRSTLTMIERKTAILTAAANAARVPAVIAVFTAAAGDVGDLEAPAKAANTIKALKEIQDKVGSIYAAAKESAAKIVGHDDKENDDATDAIANHLIKAVNYVNSVTDRAEWSADKSPDTWAALVAAQAKVVTSADAVREVMDSGRRLDARWEDLNDALSGFRRALIAHYIAIDSGPTFVGGFHVAG